MYDSIVVGAGISGLTAARRLVSYGMSVLVLERNPVVGGRLATVRIGESVFDHGAQYITFADGDFRSYFDGCVTDGAFAEWATGFVDDEGNLLPAGRMRYRGVPSMGGAAEILSRGLQIKTSVQVVSLAQDRTGGQWRVSCEPEESYGARSLVLTAPLPETVSLLSESDVRLSHAETEKLEAVSYDPCIALLVRQSTPSSIPGPGAIQLQREAVLWVCDNYRKGVSPEPGALTIHASPGFSRSYLHETDSVIVEKLRGVLRGRIEMAPEDIEVHRWRYAKSRPLRHESYHILSTDVPAVCAGDSFLGARVEAAVISGFRAADAIRRLDRSAKK